MSRLTYKQIAEAITTKLKTQFPTTTILEEDIEEGSASPASGFKFIRPSFKVTFESASADERQYNALRTMLCRILFFPTSTYIYSMEFLDTLDGLESAFALNIPVQDRVITIQSTDNQQIGDATQTKVLEFTFSLEWYDEPVQPPAQSTYTVGEIDLNLSES